jgi:hypothetical protein
LSPRLTFLPALPAAATCSAWTAGAATRSNHGGRQGLLAAAEPGRHPPCLPTPLLRLLIPHAPAAARCQLLPSPAAGLATTLGPQAPEWTPQAPRPPGPQAPRPPGPQAPSPPAPQPPPQLSPHPHPRPSSSPSKRPAAAHLDVRQDLGDAPQHGAVVAGEHHVLRRRAVALGAAQRGGDVRVAALRAVKLEHKGGAARQEHLAHVVLGRVEQRVEDAAACAPAGEAGAGGWGVGRRAGGGWRAATQRRLHAMACTHRAAGVGAHRGSR